jgi:hypothetical protein
MNNQNDALINIENFFKSDKKCMLITGTNQFKKHLLVMYVINKYYKNANVLLRTNVMENLTNPNYIGKFIDRKPKIGEQFKIENNYYSVDTFQQGSWWKTDDDYDIAIVYPMDAILRSIIKTDCISNLFNDKYINKIFLVTCTDYKTDHYSTIEQYIDTRNIYDAEEEDIRYHKRVLGLED